METFIKKIIKFEIWKVQEKIKINTIFHLQLSTSIAFYYSILI